jgi:hypothetical protein
MPDLKPLLKNLHLEMPSSTGDVRFPPMDFTNGSTLKMVKLKSNPTSSALKMAIRSL